MARLSYSRLAGFALPPVVLTLALFVYMELYQPLVCPEPTALSREDTGPVFAAIYQHGVWGMHRNGVGRSGAGSTLDATVAYRAFLQQFMKDHQIHSVVDAGCGDWEFSQAIDWTGIDYQGFDIVESVIAADKAKFERPNVHFHVANIVTEQLPAADLLICKEVLQHLPNADVAMFLKQLPKYKHVLILDAVDATTFSAENADITLEQVRVGAYRPLDITRPPFSIDGDKPLTYWANRSMHQVVHVGH